MLKHRPVAWPFRSGRLPKPAWRHRHLVNAEPPSNLKTEPTPASSDVAANRLPAQDQEELAKVAQVVLSRAKAVLNNKKSEYLKQLAEVEDDSNRNGFYRAVNSWTTRLLTRKISFVDERLRAMDALEANVLSCTLDGNCTFGVNTSISSKDMRKLFPDVFDVGELVEEAMKGNFEKADFEKKLNQQIGAALGDRDVTDLASVHSSWDYPLNASWTLADEGKDLEDVMWAAYRAADSIPGAEVQITRTYNYTEQRDAMDLELDKAVNDLLEGYIGSAEEGMDPDSTRAMVKQLLPFNEAVSTITSVWLSSSIAGVVAYWILGVTIEDTLTWWKLLPLTFGDFQTIVYWTLPLASLFGLLGLVRATLPPVVSSSARGPTASSSSMSATSSPTTPVPASAPAGLTTSLAALAQPFTLVADVVQSRRVLIAENDTPADDVRILYLIATAKRIATAAPWLYVVLPAAMTKIYELGSWDGMLLVTSGSAQQKALAGLVQLPTVALGVGVVMGTWHLIQSNVGDRFDADVGKDPTKYVEDFIQVLGVGSTWSSQLPADVTEQMLSKELQNAGLDAATAKAQAREKIAEMSEAPPQTVTMDLQSALSQRSVGQQQEWLQPTAIAALTFYLCLEALLTKQVTNPILTELIAVAVLDYISKPWEAPNMKVTVRVKSKAASAKPKTLKEIVSEIVQNRGSLKKDK